MSGLVRVRGKGKKERLTPVLANPALAAIRRYWDLLPESPVAATPVFLSEAGKPSPLSARILQVRLKRHLMAAGLDPGITPHHLRHSYATRTCWMPGRGFAAAFRRTVRARASGHDPGLYPPDHSTLPQARLYQVTPTPGREQDKHRA